MSGRRQDAKPAWWYDEDWCNWLALDNLALVLAEIDAAPPFMQVSMPAWWHQPRTTDEARRRHGLPLDPKLFACASHPSSERMLIIDHVQGLWWDGAGAKYGQNMVELVSYRLEIGKAKAAWRLAKWCGRTEPRP